MPQMDFSAMPDSARVWVFGAAAPMDGAARDAMLTAVDAHLTQWAAHGMPLVCAREWRDERFLAVAVDEAATGASGCSIDGMFRVLQRCESSLSASLTDGTVVYWRDAHGAVQSGERSAFRAAAATGAVTLATPVFDLTVTDVGAWREQFERAAAVSWHARLVGNG